MAEKKTLTPPPPGQTGIGAVTAPKREYFFIGLHMTCLIFFLSGTRASQSIEFTSKSRYFAANDTDRLKRVQKVTLSVVFVASHHVLCLECIMAV